MNKRIFSSFLIFFSMIFMAYAVNSANYQKGLDFFSVNRPSEAIPYFQQAILEGNPNPDVYNYLGLSYYQCGQLQKSLDTFVLGTQVAMTDKRVLYYNAGNTAFSMGLYDRAEELYSYALAADPSFGGAVLNRAQAHMKQTDYDNAITDYERYLVLVPDSDQAEQIRLLLAALRAEVQKQKAEEERIAQEAERLRIQQEAIEAEKARIAQEKAAAEAARKAEEERIAAEAKAAEEAAKAAEAERRRKLLEEIAATLQESESINVSAGSDGVISYDYEEELD